MFKNLKVGARLAGAFSLVVLILVSVIVLAYINLGRYSEANGWNVHTYEVLEESTGILGALVNIETGQRGFLVAGKDGFLEPLTAGKVAFSQHHAQAKKLTSDNPAQQARLDKIMGFYQSWLKDSVESSLQARRAVGDNLSDYDKVITTVGSGKTQMDAMRAVIAEVDQAERSLLSTRSKDMVSISSVTENTMLFGGLIGLVLAGFLAFWVTASITKPLGESVGFANKMAAGDFNFKLDIDSTDEVGLLAKAIEAIQASVQRMMADAALLAKAAVDGKLATRADASKHQGDFQKVVSGVNSTLDAVIGPLNVAAKYVDDISRGAIPAKITDSYNGDFNTLKNNLNTCIDAVNALVADAGLLSKAAVDGKLATRADASKHQGDFQKVVAGVNNTLDAVIGPLNVAAGYVDRISKGDIPPKITDPYNGDFNILKNNLNTCVDAVNALVADAGLLAKAAVDGKLATRADASKHQGDFQKVVAGVNNTLDAVIGPLNVAAGYVDRISKGDIPPKITDPYNGDFNILKNNLNTCIDAVNALVADATLLSAAAVEGRLETRADASKHQGDFQKIVKGVNDTLDNVVGPINEVRRIMEAMSGGDLSQTIRTAYRGDFDELKSAINQTVVKLVGIIGEVRSAADNLTNAAGQVSATAQSLSQSSSEQAASVEETTSSMEQMTASISQNTENAKVTDGMASKAAKEAAEGGEAVTKTVDDMKSIASKIGIIDDIAYQTNLLALNAAIEAARAGDHGKGFAVVAAEVRKLAERSQVAAQEIGNLASSSVKQAERAGTLLTEMVPTIRKTSDLVQEIASASSEQSSGVAQINGAMGQLNQATQQNASASEQLAATAEELGAQAEQLQQTMTFFHLDDNPRHSARKAPPTARSSSGKAKPPVSARTAAVQVNEGDFERY
jgi:methyl-accepting chemotaxis protein